jgi:hypothetical protein
LLITMVVSPAAAAASAIDAASMTSSGRGCRVLRRRLTT